jgi:hypothetical protein
MPRRENAHSLGVTAPVGEAVLQPLAHGSRSYSPSRFATYSRGPSRSFMRARCKITHASEERPVRDGEEPAPLRPPRLSGFSPRIRRSGASRGTVRTQIGKMRTTGCGRVNRQGRQGRQGRQERWVKKNPKFSLGVPGDPWRPGGFSLSLRVFPTVRLLMRWRSTCACRRSVCRSSARLSSTVTAASRSAPPSLRALRP